MDRTHRHQDTERGTTPSGLPEPGALPAAVDGDGSSAAGPAASGCAGTWAAPVRRTVGDLQRLTAEHAAHARGLSTEERRGLITDLQQVDRSVAMVRGALLRAEQASGDWAQGGHRSAEDWHARVTRTGIGPARSAMRLVEDAQAQPALGRALEDGSVSLEHARRLCELARKDNAPARRRALEGPLGEELVRAAQHQTVTAFTRTAARRMADVDRAGPATDFQAAREARYLRTETRPGGAPWGEFLLDPTAAQYMATALDAATPAPATGDARSREQRRADALTAMAEAATASRTLKPGALLPSQVCLVVRDRALAAQVPRLGGDGPQAMPPPSTTRAVPVT